MLVSPLKVVMDGSSSSSLEHPARLDSLHVTIPCKTASDALLSSLSVALSDDFSSNVLDALLALFQDPVFCSKDVTFQSAQDISNHISEQRKRIAQKRSSVAPASSSGKASLYGSETMNVYGGVPQLIVDFVAQQLAREMIPFQDQVDWDTNIYNASNTESLREHDLLSMTLVHRTWTDPATRALRSRIKITGSKDLQTFLRSPRMGPWLREIYFVECLENENVREMVRLLTLLLKNTPNLKRLCIRTWWRLGVPNIYDLHDVVMQLENMHELESLWLFPNRGQGACLPALVKVLPHLRSLKKLHVRNWMGGAPEEQELNATLQHLLDTTSASVRLTTLSFVDGGMNTTTSLFLPWLLRDCPLTNLEVHTKDICRLESGETSPMFRALRPFLSKIKTLRLHYSSLNDDRDARDEFVSSCTNVKTFSLVVGLHHELNRFPDSVETLHMHYSTIWPITGKRLCETLEQQQESLTKLRTVTLTKDPVDVLIDAGVLEDEDERLEAAWHIGDVKQFCEERKIELSNSYGFISFDELSSL